MLKEFFKSKGISEKEKEFFIKINQYLIKNCTAVYGTEYIPRLVQQICKAIDIYIECHNGILTIINNDIKYDIPYTFNFYKNQIIDLGTFVVKFNYKKEEFDSINKNQFKETPLFDKLPSFIISGENHKDLPPNVTYESKKLILNKDFQPTEISKNDKLLLAVYNNCMAGDIAREIVNSTTEINSDINPIINLSYFPKLLISK